MPLTDDQRLEAIQEHAWRWFAYHAEQRTTMFNFFLTAAAILIAGFVGAIGEGHRWVAGAIGLLGFLVSFCFIMLDSRNQALVRLGEKAVDKFEEVVFLKRAGGASKVLIVDGVQFPRGIHTAEPARRPGDGFWLGKHKVYLRGVQGILGIVFFVGMLIAWRWPEMLESREKADLVQIKADLQTLTTEIRSLESKIRVSNEVPSPGAQ